MEVDLEVGELVFECSDALGEGVGGGLGGGGLGERVGEGGVERAAEEMGVTGLAGAGLAGEDGGEGAGGVGVDGAGIGVWWGGGAGGEAVEGGDDGGEVVEGEEAVGAAAEFAGGLGAAEEEEAEEGGLVAAEVEDGAGAVLVLGDACVAIGCGEAEILKDVEGLADVFLFEIEDGIAAGALVAGVDERVEGEGIVLGRGDLFFDERAEDAELDGGGLHMTKMPQAGGCGWVRGSGLVPVE